MKLLSHIRINRSLLSQLSLVFAAFLIMVLLGGYFSSRAVNKHIANYGDEVITAMAETVRTYLQGYEITLQDVAFVLEKLQAESAGADAIQDSLSQWSYWLYTDDERFSDGLFLFCVIDGVFISSSGWEYPDDYLPESRLWYTGAYMQNGGVFYSDPYVDAHTGEYVLTLSKLLFDEDHEPFGVIGLDVFLSSISEYINKMQLMNSGYGMMMDSNRRILVHPATELFGVQLEAVTGGVGYADMAELLIAGKDVSAFNITSVLGVKSVAFTKKIFNGWYIGLSLPSEVYYSEAGTMRFILSATGFVLALLLCGVLTFMHIAKNRSENASRIKSSFLANMSHEIRTPMNAVIGMTELLQHEQLSKRQRDYVDSINSSAHSLLSLINDILDLSKIESGKLTLNPVNYEFYTLLDNINSMFQYVAQKKGLEFRFESVGETPDVLYGDDVRLRQVLTNLCGNAVKYTDKGYVRLKVTTLGDMIIFEVRDTGMGIKKEAMPEIFNSFEQDKSEKNRNIVGTGLGLAISKTFVEMMDGSIMLESEEGQGTIVTVMIPLILGSEYGVKDNNWAQTELTICAPDAKVLLVDDNEFNLKVAHGMLGLFGIDANTAGSGKDAIDMVKNNKYDIVFMDHMMPEMDGVEAVGEIRKLGGEHKTLPIVALTANAVLGAKEMFLANGFNDFLSKPIELQELSIILADWLPLKKIIQKPTAEKPAGAAGDTQSDIRAAIDDTGSIGEINAEIGLRRVSGIERVYYDNLKLFHSQLIPEYERLSACIRDNDIDSFSISVHAMKSTLSTIGAMKLSGEAAKLETAAKNSDLVYCTEQFPEFKERLLSLHKALSAVFPEKDDKPAPQKEPGESGYLQEQIKVALAAADDFDNEAGMGSIEKLLVFDYGGDINALLEKALGAFREYDCVGALETLEKIVS